MINEEFDDYEFEGFNVGLQPTRNVRSFRFHPDSSFDDFNSDLLVQKIKSEQEEISTLFGSIGNKFVKASSELRISNEFSNLAFIRHMINYYSFMCSTGYNTQESIDKLFKLKKKLPSIKEIKKYFKEFEIWSLNKFELLAIKIILDIHFYTEKLYGSPPYKKLSKSIIPVMIEFYESMPQAKFFIMITLYRAFAEDSKEYLNEIDNHAYSIPYTFLQKLRKLAASLKETTKGCTKEDFYV
eukprot:CAMPEP_0168334086 /NCGR_PEP_ID=MMETSP0213-20121227/10034_1 /TAXON_ID=151035 /ORGANISM="Euplotes harpa, Strain FSP1.4" /LENGTH=240 /DNA_ID=CAMNT_0008338615 /DNA_START=21 /DNA_END=743 /DNA_ORIENTATION=-